MGLFDMFKPKKQEVGVARSALDEANDLEANDDAITKFIENILSLGLKGRGPFEGSAELAEKALKVAKGDREEAIDKVAGQHVRSGAVGGFVTSLGGFVTMPVAIPANVLEFYVQATRMVGAIAHLRGYDINDPRIRSAVLLTLVGSKAEDVMAKAGVPLGPIGGGRVLSVAVKNMPKSALMVINKAVGFRLMRSVGEKALTRFGKAIPLAGGVIGGGLDGWMMKRIAEHARGEFPQKTTLDI
ncbi:EcsC family protein [Mariniluteicoccus endophyticus]